MSEGTCLKGRPRESELEERFWGEPDTHPQQLWDWQIQSFGNTKQDKANGATCGQSHLKAPLDTRQDLIVTLKGT